MAVYTLNHNPELTDMVDLFANIPFASPGGEELALQLLKPRWSSGGKGFPLVLFIQGSGWTKPNQFWQLPQMSLLARRGFGIASVTHRSSLTAPAPAFLRDVKAALRFLRAHAKTYDIDKDRVCAWGTSSGGNTALLLGLTADDPAFETEDWAGESTAVQAVVDCFGPTDLPKMLRTQPVLSATMQQLTRGMSEKALEQISPLRLVKHGMELPPFLILHGDADELVLYEDSETFYHKLVEHGYEADFVHVANAPHEGSFWSMELIELIFGFIQQKLGA